MAKTLTVIEAMEMTTYKKTTVQRWCNEKLVKAHKNERGTWLIDADDLDRYLKETAQQRAQFNFSQEAKDKGNANPRRKGSQVDWDVVDQKIAARLAFVRKKFPGKNYPKGLIKEWVLDNMPTKVPQER